MKVSRHGKERVAERVGVGKSKANRQATLALERGYHVHELAGNLQKWAVSQVYYSNKKRSKVILYNNNLFVFDSSDDTLITVIPLPSNLKKAYASLTKKSKKKKVSDNV